MAEKAHLTLNEHPPVRQGLDEATRKWILPLAIIVGASFAAQAAAGMLVQLYLKELGAQPLIISLNMALFWLAMFIGSFLWGMLVDRFAIKPLLLGIVGTTGVMIAVLAVPMPVSGILSSVFLRGLMISGVAPISMAVVSRASSAEMRGRNLSYVVFPRTLGRALGTAIAGFLLAALGFRASFPILIAFPLIGLPLLLPLREEKKTSSVRRESSLRRLKATGLSSLYVGATLTQMAAVGSLSLVFVHMASLGIPAGVMGAVGALEQGVAILGVLLCGRFVDRFRRKRVFSLGFGMAILMPLIFAFSRNIWGMAAGFVALGMAFSALYIGSTAHISDLTPAQRHGQMLGLFASSRAFGGVLGPLVAGATISTLGFQGMFLVMAGIATLGFLLVLFDQHSTANDLPLK